MKPTTKKIMEAFTVKYAPQKYGFTALENIPVNEKANLVLADCLDNAKAIVYTQWDQNVPLAVFTKIGINVIKGGGYGDKGAWGMYLFTKDNKRIGMSYADGELWWAVEN